jgi:hypothetical protein
MFTVTGVDVVVFASGSTVTDRVPRLRQCAEYRTVRVCARFEFLRAEELGASILGDCDVQGGIVFQNTYCVCPKVFHVAYFRSLNLGFYIKSVLNGNNHFSY